MNSKYQEQTCCFVGHKDIPPGEQLKILARVEHRLIPLIQQGVTYFGIGGSLGFDTLMADMLVSLKAAHPRIRIIEVLPFEGYRSKWSLEQQRHAEKIDKQVDKIVYIAKRAKQGSIPSKRQAFNRLLCLTLYLLLYKDYRRYGVFGKIRSGTWRNGV